MHSFVLTSIFGLDPQPHFDFDFGCDLSLELNFELGFGQYHARDCQSEVDNSLLPKYRYLQ